MRRLAIVVFLVAVLASLPARADAASWAEPASSLNQTEAAGLPGPDVKRDRNVGAPVIEAVGGVLHAAWTEWDGQNFEVRVARLEGNEWVALGSGCSPVNVDGTRDAADVDLADHGGRPFVAWVEPDANGLAQVQAARFENGAWVRPWGALTNEQPDGPGGTLVNSSLDTSIEVADGRVYVASRIVRPIPYLNQVHRLRADETAFEKIAAPYVSDSFHLEIHSDGEELYAWTRGTLDDEVSRFDGEEWDALPGPAERWSLEDMTVRDGDAYFLFWSEPGLRVRRFDGQQWHQVVADSTSYPQGRITSLAFIGDALHYTFILDGDVSVHRIDPGAWTVVEQRVNKSDAAVEWGGPAPTAAQLLEVGGRPYVAWAGWSGQIWKARVAGLLDAPPASVPPREQLSGCAAPAQETGGEQPAGEQPAGEQSGRDTTGGDGPTPPGPTPPAAAPPRAQVPSQSPLRSRLVLLNPRNKARRGIVRLRVRCAGGERCRGTAIARARSRIRGMEIGRVRVNLARGEVATIRLRLAPRAIRMLRRGPVRYALTLRTPV